MNDDEAKRQQIGDLNYRKKLRSVKRKSDNRKQWERRDAERRKMLPLVPYLFVPSLWTRIVNMETTIENMKLKQIKCIEGREVIHQRRKSKGKKKKKKIGESTKHSLPPHPPKSRLFTLLPEDMSMMTPHHNKSKNVKLTRPNVIDEGCLSVRDLVTKFGDKIEWGMVTETTDDLDLIRPKEQELLFTELIQKKEGIVTKDADDEVRPIVETKIVAAPRSSESSASDQWTYWPPKKQNEIAVQNVNASRRQSVKQMVSVRQPVIRMDTENATKLLKEDQDERQAIPVWMEQYSVLLKMPPIAKQKEQTDRLHNDTRGKEDVISGEQNGPQNREKTSMLETPVWMQQFIN